MNIINLRLKNKVKYSIFIDFKLFKKINNIYPLNKDKKIILITNKILEKIHLNYLYNKLNELNLNYTNIIIEDGESYKSLDSVNLIITKMLKENFNRDSVLISFGGGVIGDLSGFVSSIYQRGIKYIQIPTTLLSQIDSSIGGKTGVNHILGKNMIGTFYQPSSVYIDTYFLSTLNNKELSSGLSEAIKYSIMLDYKFFIWLEKNTEKLINLDIDTINYCVYKCCLLKSKIIKKDEKELLNIRSILNFGHTYGHAIESFLGYGKWTHGQAVSAGMMMAINTAVILNKFDINLKERIKKLILKFNLPIKGPESMRPEDYIIYMKRDKKNNKNEIKIIIPEKIGKFKILDNVKKEIIISSINMTNN